MPPRKKKTRQLGRYVDRTTGELVDLVRLDRPSTAQPHKESNFGFVYFLELEKVARDEQLSNFDVRLFVLMASKIDFNNVVNSSQSRFAKALSVTPSQVSKSLKNLVAGEYVGVVDRGKFVLDAESVWKGSGEDRDKFVAMGLKHRVEMMIKELE